MQTNFRFLLLAIVGIAVMALSAPKLHADDYYVLEGRAHGGSVLTTTTFLLWSSDVTFFNRGSSAAVVRLLGASNGRPTNANDMEFELPPGRSAALSRIRPDWLYDDPSGSLTVLHVDAPPTVSIESSLYIGTSTSVLCCADPEQFGKTRLPVVRTLAAAGDAQVHLSTDLGAIPSRLNVGVYNSGSVAASAVIQVRQFCDDSVIDSRTVTVPANSVIQAFGFQTTMKSCPDPGGAGSLGRPNGVYVAVVSDQPGFSFVSALSNADVPTTSISIVGPSSPN